MASDRRWYPPELHPNAQKAAPARPTNGAASASATRMPQTVRSGSPQSTATRPGPVPRAQPQAVPQHQAAAAHQQMAAGVPGYAMPDEAPGSPNRLAGLVGIVGSVFTILGSFLTWAVDNGKALAGFENVPVSFSGFSSNGELTLLFGVLGLIAAGLLLAGIRPGWAWGILALVAGAAAIAVLFFSYLDITGSASADWSNRVGDASDLGRAAADDAGIGLRTSIGFWLTGLGALVLAVVPPFLRRD